MSASLNPEMINKTELFGEVEKITFDEEISATSFSTLKSYKIIKDNEKEKTYVEIQEMSPLSGIIDDPKKVGFWYPDIYKCFPPNHLLMMIDFYNSKTKDEDKIIINQDLYKSVNRYLEFTQNVVKKISMNREILVELVNNNQIFRQQTLELEAFNDVIKQDFTLHFTTTDYCRTINQILENNNHNSSELLDQFEMKNTSDVTNLNNIRLRYNNNQTDKIREIDDEIKSINSQYKNKTKVISIESLFGDFDSNQIYLEELIDLKNQYKDSDILTSGIKIEEDQIKEYLIPIYKRIKITRTRINIQSINKMYGKNIQPTNNVFIWQNFGGDFEETVPFIGIETLLQAVARAGRGDNDAYKKIVNCYIPESYVEIFNIDDFNSLNKMNDFLQTDFFKEEFRKISFNKLNEIDEINYILDEIIEIKKDKDSNLTELLYDVITKRYIDIVEIDDQENRELKAEYKDQFGGSNSNSDLMKKELFNVIQKIISNFLSNTGETVDLQDGLLNGLLSDLIQIRESELAKEEKEREYQKKREEEKKEKEKKERLERERFEQEERQRRQVERERKEANITRFRELINQESKFKSDLRERNRSKRSYARVIDCYKITNPDECNNQKLIDGSQKCYYNRTKKTCFGEKNAITQININNEEEKASLEEEEKIINNYFSKGIKGTIEDFCKSKKGKDECFGEKNVNNRNICMYFDKAKKCYPNKGFVDEYKETKDIDTNKIKDMYKLYKINYNNEDLDVDLNEVLSTENTEPGMMESVSSSEMLPVSSSGMLPVSSSGMMEPVSSTEMKEPVSSTEMKEPVMMEPVSSSGMMESVSSKNNEELQKLELLEKQVKKDLTARRRSLKSFVNVNDECSKIKDRERCIDQKLDGVKKCYYQNKQCLGDRQGKEKAKLNNNEENASLDEEKKIIDNYFGRKKAGLERSEEELRKREAEAKEISPNKIVDKYRLYEIDYNNDLNAALEEYFFPRKDMGSVSSKGDKKEIIESVSSKEDKKEIIESVSSKEDKKEIIEPISSKEDKASDSSEDKKSSSSSGKKGKNKKGKKKGRNKYLINFGDFLKQYI
jgi:hypothetical protein